MLFQDYGGGKSLRPCTNSILYTITLLEYTRYVEISHLVCNKTIGRLRHVLTGIYICYYRV